MRIYRRPRFAVAMTLAALTMATVVALPASAANTVTQTINAGTRTASVTDLALGTVNYSHSAQSSTGTMVLAVDDSSGTGAGWNVTVLSSEFVYSGTNGGSAIPAANFSVTAAADATATAGQAVDETSGPNAGTTGSLDTSRKVLSADANFGQGSYTQDLDVSLSIPGQSRVGTYTGTLTVTVSAAP